jgi:hypothetical protein
MAIKIICDECGSPVRYADLSTPLDTDALLQLVHEENFAATHELLDSVAHTEGGLDPLRALAQSANLPLGEVLLFRAQETTLLAQRSYRARRSVNARALLRKAAMELLLVAAVLGD